MPISYAPDRDRAERILLEAARRHGFPITQMSEGAAREMQRRYVLQTPDLQPKVYFRLTDNWLELTVRFIVRDHGIRELKDAMSRDILRALDDAGIPSCNTGVGLVRCHFLADDRKANLAVLMVWPARGGKRQGKASRSASKCS